MQLSKIQTTQDYMMLVIVRNKSMGIYSNQYSRENFINKFLRKNNVSNIIIDKFVSLPERIIIDDHNYDLYININVFNVGDTYYEFELNYYSEELVEFLFNSKVFQNVELSINYLICELIDKEIIVKESECKK